MTKTRNCTPLSHFCSSQLTLFWEHFLPSTGEQKGTFLSPDTNLPVDLWCYGRIQGASCVWIFSCKVYADQPYLSLMPASCKTCIQHAGGQLLQKLLQTWRWWGWCNGKNILINKNTEHYIYLNRKSSNKWKTYLLEMLSSSVKNAVL